MNLITFDKRSKKPAIRNSQNRQGIKIIWSEVMLEILRNKFPTEYNKHMSIALGVSVRTVIRKARELLIYKEPKFLEFRKMQISAMAQAAKKENKNKGNKGWCVPNSEGTRFKPGNVSLMSTNQKIRDKVSRSRLKIIEEERYRIREGLDQITKLKFRV